MTAVIQDNIYFQQNVKVDWALRNIYFNPSSLPMKELSIWEFELFSKVIYLVRNWIGYLQKSLELKQSSLCTAWGNVIFTAVRRKLEYSYPTMCFKITSLKYFTIWFTNWLGKKKHLRFSVNSLWKGPSLFHNSAKKIEIP